MPALKTLATNMYYLVNFYSAGSEMPPVQSRPLCECHCAPPTTTGPAKDCNTYRCTQRLMHYYTLEEFML